MPFNLRSDVGCVEQMHLFDANVANLLGIVPTNAIPLDGNATIKKNVNPFQNQGIQPEFKRNNNDPLVFDEIGFYSIFSFFVNHSPLGRDFMHEQHAKIAQITIDDAPIVANVDVTGSMLKHESKRFHAFFGSGT